MSCNHNRKSKFRPTFNNFKECCQKAVADTVPIDAKAVALAPWAPTPSSAGPKGQLMREFNQGGISWKTLQDNGFKIGSTVQCEGKEYTLDGIDAKCGVVIIQPCVGTAKMKLKVPLAEFMDCYRLAAEKKGKTVLHSEMISPLQSQAVRSSLLQGRILAAVVKEYQSHAKKVLVNVSNIGGSGHPQVVAAKAYSKEAPLVLVPLTHKVGIFDPKTAKTPSLGGGVSLGVYDTTTKHAAYLPKYAFDEKENMYVPFWIVDQDADSAKPNMIVGEVELQVEGFGTDGKIKLPVFRSRGDIAVGDVLKVAASTKSQVSQLPKAVTNALEQLKREGGKGGTASARKGAGKGRAGKGGAGESKGTGAGGGSSTDKGGAEGKAKAKAKGKATGRTSWLKRPLQAQAGPRKAQKRG